VLRAAALAVLVALLAAGRPGLWPLLVVAALLGVGEVLFDCASFAVLPAITPADRLESANGTLFTTQTISRDLLGQLLGGVLYQIGRAVPLVLDAASFAVSALLLTRLPAQRAERPAGRTLLRADIVAGIRHIRDDRLLSALTLAGGVLNAVSIGQVAILVVFVRDVLRLGPTGYAAVLATGAVGGAVGGLVAGRLVRHVGRRATLLGGLGLVALAGLGAALAHTATTVVGYFAMGLGFMMWNVVAVSLRQSITPAHLLGRITGAYRLFSWGTMPFGAMLFGAMATAWGTPGAFAGGVVLILLLGLSLAPVVCRDARLADHGSPAAPGAEPMT
jgi:MFS family permease